MSTNLQHRESTDKLPLFIKTLIGLAVFVGLLAVMIVGTEFFTKDDEAQAGSQDFASLTPRQQADILFETGGWKRAGNLYKQLVDQDRFNSLAMFRYAYCLHKQEDYEGALEAYKLSLDFNEVRAISLYNMACIYAVSGEPDLAIQCLRETIEEGFTTRHGIGADEDFASLLGDPEFDRLADIEIQRRRRR